MIDFANHDLFEPGSIFASQPWTPRAAQPDPERALIVAVLEDAARCLLDPGRHADQRKHRLYREAKDWILSSDDTGLYTFESVCAVLDLDAGAVRRRLLASATGDPAASPRSQIGEGGLRACSRRRRR